MKILIKKFFKPKPETILQSMAFKLVCEEQEPDKIQECPICSGQLVFSHIVSEVNVNGKKIIILLMCIDCQNSISVHILSPVPKWGRERKEGERVPRPRKRRDNL